MHDDPTIEITRGDDPTIGIITGDETAPTLADAQMLARFAVELPGDAEPGTHVGSTAVELGPPGAFGDDAPFVGTVRFLDSCPPWTFGCTTYLPATLLP